MVVSHDAAGNDGRFVSYALYTNSALDACIGNLFFLFYCNIAMPVNLLYINVNMCHYTYIIPLFFFKKTGKCFFQLIKIR